MQAGLDKEALLQALMAQLRKEMNAAIAASRDAASYATDEESRAESKWDTQGLEASYLAAGQAGQAREWSLALQTLDAGRAELIVPKVRAEMGAVVICQLGTEADRFFLVPVAGGQEIAFGGAVYTTLTRQAPLAARLWGKVEGNAFALPNGMTGRILRVG